MLAPLEAEIEDSHKILDQMMYTWYMCLCAKNTGKRGAGVGVILALPIWLAVHEKVRLDKS